MSELWKLFLVFALIIVFVKYKYPLWTAMLVGLAMTALLFRVPLPDTFRLMYEAAKARETLSLLLSFYSITYLQRMMEGRGYLLRVERAMDHIFRNRRVNVTTTPMLIGLLPSAGAVLLAAPIVDRSGGEWLSRDEKTFVASYYRHIPESFLPTYSSILLALRLSGYDMTLFVTLMLPMVAVLILLGAVFYVRRLPARVEERETVSMMTRRAVSDLFLCLWPIVVSVGVVLAAKVPVYFAIPGVVLVFAVAERFSPRELIPMLYSAAEKKLLFTTVIIMQFKEILMFTGILTRLPDCFSLLVLPPAVIFGLIFFVGTLISGSQAMIALCLPMSLAVMKDAGIGFFVFVMNITYIAMQISPAHICLEIVCEAFGTGFFGLVRKTLPVLLCFLVICSAYCYALCALGL